MALEDIFRALEEQADAECDEILQGARSHADSIAAEAREQAAEIKRAHVEAAEREVRTTAAQRLNAARLDGRKRVGAVKDRAIASAFDAAASRLSGLRGDKRYDAVFRGLAEEALAGVEGEVEVFVGSADADLAKRMMKDLGRGATAVEVDDSISGGLVVLTAGGRVYRRNTFQDRLARLRECCQAEVAGILLA